MVNACATCLTSIIINPQDLLLFDKFFEISQKIQIRGRFKSEFEETFSVIRKNQLARNSQNEMVESISKYEKLTWH